MLRVPHDSGFHKSSDVPHFTQQNQYLTCRSPFNLPSDPIRIVLPVLHFQTMSHQTYAITGIRDGTGPGLRVPSRLEIDTLYNPQADTRTRYQFALFILALNFLQKMDINDKLSYFQIAG